MAVSQTSPRGTDRVRRRATQQQHAEKAVVEGANLTSPSGPEKTAAIEANKVKALAAFGATGENSIRKTRQRANREKAEVEAAELASPRLPSSLRPGAQVDLQTANRLAQEHDAEQVEFETEAGRAAGLAVRDTLRGKPLRSRHSRSRYIAQHNARVEARNAAAAK